MTTNKLKINRAPVLTLWAVVVAERLGYKHEEALTIVKALTGLTAQSHGRPLGLFHPAKNGNPKAEKQRTPGYPKDNLVFNILTE